MNSTRGNPFPDLDRELYFPFPFRVGRRGRSHWQTPISIAAKSVCCHRDMPDLATTVTQGITISTTTIPSLVPMCYWASAGFTIHRA